MFRQRACRLVTLHVSRTLATSAEEHGFRYILREKQDRVGIATLNRPKSMNALNTDMCKELSKTLREFDDDSSVGSIVLTGSERAFATGADVNELMSQSFMDARHRFDSGFWISVFDQLRKPTICAVNGYALGGGCEIAMACDIILAGDNAQFGQPEVQLGTIPGWGGTQRLVRAVGKAKAMELILTGRRMNAEEAESAGLVARVVPSDKLFSEAVAVAKTIAGYSAPVVATAKECVNASANMSLRDGLLFERRGCQATFVLDDFQEGMKAFIDQRQPEWRQR